MRKEDKYTARRFRNVEDRFRNLREERDRQRDQDFRNWETEQEYGFRHWGPDLEWGFQGRGYPEHDDRMDRRNNPQNEFYRQNPGGRPVPRSYNPRREEEREYWRPENSGRIGHMEQYAHMNRLVGGESFGSDYRRMLKAMDDYWQGGMDEQPDYGSYYRERGSAFRPMPSGEQRNMHRRSEYGEEAWHKASKGRHNRGRR